MAKSFQNLKPPDFEDLKTSDFQARSKTIDFLKGSPAAAQGLNNTNVLGGLNDPSNRGTLKVAENKNLLLATAQMKSQASPILIPPIEFQLNLGSEPILMPPIEFHINLGSEPILIPPRDFNLNLGSRPILIPPIEFNLNPGFEQVLIPPNPSYSI